jgi:hypothetical protein
MVAADEGSAHYIGVSPDLKKKIMTKNAWNTKDRTQTQTKTLVSCTLHFPSACFGIALTLQQQIRAKFTGA